MIDLDDVFVLHAGVDHDVAALRGLSLHVAERERVVVWGPSGSGKSTLISVVTAHIRPSAGRARLFGVDIGLLGERQARALRRGTGIVSQRSARDLLPELTVADNVALQARLGGAGRRDALRAAREMIGEFSLSHLANRNPRSLSGGELQRVALAAALVDRPALVVADEPTGELDAANAALVYDQLARYCADFHAALLLVSHDLEAERIADRVLTINDGRLSDERADGTDALVVDRRGWVRLPEAARRRSGMGERVAIATGDDYIRLQASNSPQRSAESTAASSAASSASPPSPVTRSVAVLLDDVVVDVGGGARLGPISAELGFGELVAIVGPSGSGKTTLLATIIARSEETLSCCPQAPGFAETRSVEENVEMGRSLRSQPTGDEQAERLEEMLEALGLLALARRPAANLSGGERQRVAVARALLTDSAVVIVDEPTSQLDRGTAARVIAVLRRAAGDGRCIICATHDAALIDQADQVIRLDERAGP